MPTITTAERDGTGLDGASRPTEDRIAVLEDAVVLLDGATETREPPPAVTVPEYVDALLAALAAELAARPGRDLGEVLADAVNTMAGNLRLTPGAAPSSTAAIVRWTPSTVDALVLADSPVVLFTDRGHTVVTDERIARLAAAGRLGDEAAASLRNAEDGFWVAEADPAAASRAVRASLPREEVRAALLASDGVSCGVDRYGLFDWDGVRARCETGGPEPVLNEIVAAERVDAARARWPRSKVHDDKALAVVRFACGR